MNSRRCFFAFLHYGTRFSALCGYRRCKTEVILDTFLEGTLFKITCVEDMFASLKATNAFHQL